MPKGIFIGLGGAGVATVARLKALLFQRTYESNMDAMSQDCSFVFYDTDSYTKSDVLNDSELQRMMDRYPVIDLATEYIDAGDTSPDAIYEYAKDSSEEDIVGQRVLEWFTNPSFREHFPLPFGRLHKGACAQRMSGRTGFMNKRKDFEAKILAGLQHIPWFVNQGGLGTCPAIWVFSSCCGGTGSSALMDVLYLVDRLYRQTVEDVNPCVRLVLYMPKLFIEKSESNPLFHLNSYATLWELNEFRYDYEMRGDGKKFGAFAAVPDKAGWDNLGGWPVCSYVMAIDSGTQNGHFISTRQMYDSTAELCHVLHSAAGQHLVAHLDNDYSIYGPYFQNPQESQADSFSWCRFVLGAGCRAVVKADDFLKDYVKKRLLYDLYGCVLGSDFEAVVPEIAERENAAKRFAEDHIMRFLISIDDLDSSPKDSLYGLYLKEFDRVPIPLEVCSRAELNDLEMAFFAGCENLVQEIVNGFNLANGHDSRSAWIKKIENSVMEGVDNSILKHGLKYTFSLLGWVSDEYCQTVINRFPSPASLSSLKEEIHTVVAELKSFRSIFFLPSVRRERMAALSQLMTEYRHAVMMSLTKKHILAILNELTVNQSAFLERIRRGNCFHKGVHGMIEVFSQKFACAKNDYEGLASAFLRTQADVYTDYFPRVHEFVDEEASWIPGNAFETIYSSLVPPGIRDGIEAVLGRIKRSITQSKFFFAEMALSDSTTDTGNYLRSFIDQVECFIEDALNSHDYPFKLWLERDLDSVFYRYFTDENGQIDIGRKNSYTDSFLNRIPESFPEDGGPFPSRFLFFGTSLALATDLGYDPAFNMSFVNNPNQSHRMLVCRFEAGRSFSDYKFFPSLNSIYERERKRIKSLGYVCHIHKDFVTRDIVSAYNRKKNP